MPSDAIEPPFICPGCGTEYDTSEAAARCYGIEPRPDCTCSTRFLATTLTGHAPECPARG